MVHVLNTKSGGTVKGAGETGAPAVALSEITKTYGAGVKALDGVTLDIAAGEVTGVAGPNGAGKSTLLSIIGGFLAPTSGEARVFGRRPAEFVRTAGMAYLPELVRLPPSWTVEETLLRLGALGGLPAPAAARRAADAIAELGLEPHSATKTGKLSKGNLQRLGIAQALLSDSDLIIFDEPSNGLDPVWVMRFRELIRRLRRPGRVILVASHNLDELERLTDSVIILGRGRVEKVVRHSAQPAAGPAAFRLRLLRPCAELPAVFPGAAAVPGRENEFRLELDAEALNAGLLKLLQAGAAVVSLQPEQGALERAFAETVEGKK